MAGGARTKATGTMNPGILPIARPGAKPYLPQRREDYENNGKVTNKAKRENPPNQKKGPPPENSRCKPLRRRCAENGEGEKRHQGKIGDTRRGAEEKRQEGAGGQDV